MKSVGAGFGDQVDHAAARPAHFSREIAGGNTVFLDGIERNLLAYGGGEFVVVRNAVEHDVRAGGAKPVNGEADAAAAGIGFRNVGNRGDEIVGVQCQGGKLGDQPLIDRAGNGLRFRVHVGSGFLDLYRGAGGADFQFEIGAEALADAEGDALFCGSESRRCYCYVIGSRSEIGKCVDAARIGLCFARKTCFGVEYFETCAGLPLLPV